MKDSSHNERSGAHEIRMSVPTIAHWTPGGVKYEVAFWTLAGGWIRDRPPESLRGVSNEANV